MRTEKEIDEMIGKIMEKADPSKLWGMTYWDGLRTALDWVLEEFNDDPTEG